MIIYKVRHKSLSLNNKVALKAPVKLMKPKPDVSRT